MVWRTGIAYPGCLRRRDERWESKIRSEARGRELRKEARERGNANREEADRQSRTNNFVRGHLAFRRIEAARAKGGIPLTRSEVNDVRNYCLDYPQAGEQWASAQEATCSRRW
jgi:Ni/Co efflux regulator RcnB